TERSCVMYIGCDNKKETLLGSWEGASQISKAVFSGDGKTLVVALAQRSKGIGKLVSWDTGDPEYVPVQKGNPVNIQSGVRDISVSHDGSRLFILNEKGHVTDLPADPVKPLDL